MLPTGLLANKRRWFWLAFLFLSPFAYLAGMKMVARYDPIAQTGLTYDRQGAIELAQRYAAERGFDVSGWDSQVSTRFDNTLRIYYRQKEIPDNDRLGTIAPFVSTRVLFYSADNGTLQVFLTPRGELVGYDRRTPAAITRPDPGEEAANSLARAALARAFTPEEIARLEPPKVESDNSGRTVIRRYAWSLPFAPGPELTLTYRVTVRGDQVTYEDIDEKITDAYKKNFIYQGSNASFSATDVTLSTIISSALYYLLVVVLFILGFYRFIQRARQRELSYSRIALLTVLIAALFLAIILLTDVATYDNIRNNNSASTWQIYLFGTLGYLLMGLIVALVYGGGEGDVREVSPGKLTSLDALTTGRIFSRNVARAVVIGCAFGGWGLLASNLVSFIWRHDPTAGHQIQMLDFLFARLPWLTPLVIWPVDVVLAAVVCLLVPLPFLQRRIRRRKIVIGVLALLAWIAGTGVSATFTPWTGAALLGAVKAALLIIPFLAFDLLTALVALAGPTFAMAVVHLLAQPAPALKEAGIISFGIATLFLLVEIIFVFRGRLYREEEVRPLYAGLLAERLSMQAEVSAAREAQIRLLPESMPEHPRLKVAAECRPAHEVGGDFYEVFRLDADRIGIFMAEGGGRGLASALSIAYAKGFIMPRILGEQKGDDSPTEIVRSLQSHLRQTLDRETEMGFAYLVLDTAEEQLRYARTGSYPRLVVKRAGSHSPAQSPNEHELVFEAASGAPHEPADTFTITSGMMDLEPGDQIIIFTDGLATAIASGKHTTAAEIDHKLLSWEVNTEDGLNKALSHLLDEAGRSAQRLGLTDDLTAVIVRIAERAKSEASA